MKIKKIYQGELPENKILNTQSTSQTDTYSCEYINNLGTGGGSSSGVVLYENAEGNSGNVTLTGNLSDYSYFEVYYGSSTPKIFISKFPVGNILFTLEYIICAAVQPYVRYKTYDIVDNSFNVNTFTAYRISMKDGSFTNETDSAVVYIFKVIGYK